MRSTTLCFLVSGNPVDRILLGWKKTGFGQGKYNGFGGKIEEGETVLQAAVRELHEECGIIALPGELEPVGRLEFIFPVNSDFDHDVFIFLVRKWQGQPRETVEMKPCWKKIEEIPYQQMWSDDIYWLPKVLAGEQITGRVVFQDDNEKIKEMDIS
jgi:8-oxo-dGTP diphosphatase